MEKNPLKLQFSTNNVFVISKICYFGMVSLYVHTDN